MKIEARHLHTAADEIGATQDVDANDELCRLAPGALVEFVRSSKWSGFRRRRLKIDPLSLGLGVSVGLLAGRQFAEHEIMGHRDPDQLKHQSPAAEETKKGAAPCKPTDSPN